MLYVEILSMEKELQVVDQNSASLNIFPRRFAFFSAFSLPFLLLHFIFRLNVSFVDYWNLGLIEMVWR